MPCRLIDDPHEWRNEISTVPNQNPLNTLFWCKGQRHLVGSEDPVKLYCSLLLLCKFCCAAQVVVVKAFSSEGVQTKSETPPFKTYMTYLYTKDTIMQTVWLGRHPAEKISAGPNGQLIGFRNPEKSARAKANLTVFRIKRNAGRKLRSSEPLCPH